MLNHYRTGDEVPVPCVDFCCITGCRLLPDTIEKMAYFSKWLMKSPTLIRVNKQNSAKPRDAEQSAKNNPRVCEIRVGSCA
jgi:hypothetical protein